MNFGALHDGERPARLAARFYGDSAVSGRPSRGDWGVAFSPAERSSLGLVPTGPCADWATSCGRVEVARGDVFAERVDGIRDANCGFRCRNNQATRLVGRL